MTIQWNWADDPPNNYREIFITDGFIIYTGHYSHRLSAFYVDREGYAKRGDIIALAEMIDFPKICEYNKHKKVQQP